MIQYETGEVLRSADSQARKKAALLNSAPPSDPDWTAQLEKERQEEIRVISGACEVLGREIYEVGGANSTYTTEQTIASSVPRTIWNNQKLMADRSRRTLHVQRHSRSAEHHGSHTRSRGMLQPSSLLLFGLNVPSWLYGATASRECCVMSRADTI